MTEAVFVAIVGVGGTLLGAVVGGTTDLLKVKKEDEARKSDRRWDERSKRYNELVTWVAATDHYLHDLYYSYGEYAQRGSLDPEGGWMVQTVKQQEYRRTFAPSDWDQLPRPLDETVMSSLRIVAPVQIRDLADKADKMARRMVDELRSLGLWSVTQKARGEAKDTENADAVIGGLYETWCEYSDDLLDALRQWFEPGSKEGRSVGRRSGRLI